MAPTIFTFIVLNGLLFTGLAVWSVYTARTDDSDRVRVVAWALAAVSAAFVIGSITRVVAVAVSEGWLSGSVGDFLTSEWQLLQSLAALVLGLGGVAVVRRSIDTIRKQDRVVSVLTEKLDLVGRLSDLGLTARELEVLEVMADGTMSDRDIAEALYVSPATAGTHVKNIMRKAKCHNRRDLILLTSPESEGPASTGSR